jgi:hypothetical protein
LIIKRFILFVGDLTPIHDSIWQLETMQGTWHVLDVLDLGQLRIMSS